MMVSIRLSYFIRLYSNIITNYLMGVLSRLVPHFSFFHFANRLFAVDVWSKVLQVYQLLQDFELFLIDSPGNTFLFHIYFLL